MAKSVSDVAISLSLVSSVVLSHPGGEPSVSTLRHQGAPCRLVFGQRI